MNIKLFSVAWVISQTFSMWSILNPTSLIGNFLHLVVLTHKARLVFHSQTILKGQVVL